MPTASKKDNKSKKEEQHKEEHQNEEAAVEEELTTLEKADKIVRDYMLWSAGLTLIPVPALDVAAVAATQVKMVADLAKLYEINFTSQIVQTTVTTLIGTAAGFTAGSGLAMFVKGIPLIGTVLAYSSVSVTNGAATYAIGKVFTKHFEAGGTLLDLDVDKMKDHFAEQFKEGKEKMKTAKEAS
jgi:uncharacterized protein (DUF697 family)